MPVAVAFVSAVTLEEEADVFINIGAVDQPVDSRTLVVEPGHENLDGFSRAGGVRNAHGLA